MRRIWICLIALLLLLSVTACGQTEKTPETPTEPVDLTALRKKMEDVYPKMMEFEGDMRFNFLGIRDEDCAQCITLVCDDGMKADELWLLEAVDDAALERLKGLAEQRLEAKADETKDYAPAQYEIVQQGKVLVSGRYLALIVTPDAEKAAELFNDFVG